MYIAHMHAHTHTHARTRTHTHAHMLHSSLWPRPTFARLFPSLTSWACGSARQTSWSRWTRVRRTLPSLWPVWPCLCLPESHCTTWLTPGWSPSRLGQSTRAHTCMHAYHTHGTHTQQTRTCMHTHHTYTCTWMHTHTHTRMHVHTHTLTRTVYLPFPPPPHSSFPPPPHSSGEVPGRSQAPVFPEAIRRQMGRCQGREVK